MNIRINLSYGENTSFGKALYNLYYGNKVLLEMAPNRSGYPHNGGEHTLSISGEAGECRAFLELLKDQYPLRATYEVDLVLAALDKGESRINLRTLSRLDAENAEISAASMVH